MLEININNIITEEHIRSLLSIFPQKINNQISLKQTGDLQYIYLDYDPILTLRISPQGSTNISIDYRTIKEIIKKLNFQKENISMLSAQTPSTKTQTPDVTQTIQNFSFHQIMEREISAMLQNQLDNIRKSVEEFKTELSTQREKMQKEVDLFHEEAQKKLTEMDDMVKTLFANQDAKISEFSTSISGEIFAIQEWKNKIEKKILQTVKIMGE